MISLEVGAGIEVGSTYTYHTGFHACMYAYTHVCFCRISYRLVIRARGEERPELEVLKERKNDRPNDVFQ